MGLLLLLLIEHPLAIKTLSAGYNTGYTSSLFGPMYSPLLQRGLERVQSYLYLRVPPPFRWQQQERFHTSLGYTTQSSLINYQGFPQVKLLCQVAWLSVVA